MSSHIQSHRGLVAVILIAVAVLVSSTLATAQDQSPPKVEIFGGYSFFYPGANLVAKNPGAVLPLSIRQESNPRGIGGAITYNFSRWFGLTADGSGHWASGEAGLDRVDDAGFYNFSVGPKLTYRKAHFAPFIEAMVGWHRLNNETFGSSSKVGFMTGGGIDVPLTRHFGLRVIRGDYILSNHRFGSVASVGPTHMRGVRLQTGVIFMFGGGEQALPVAATCSLNPREVFAGEPVSARVETSNFNSHHPLTYNWSSTGGQVSGKETTATIDTDGLTNGSYTVRAHVSDPKRKVGGEASCDSNFTVKVREVPKNPPTASCTAAPTTVRAGDASTITVTAGNPDNRPLTYNYTTTAGRVTGNGTTASLDTAGANAGPATVTATVSDDRGLTANCNATVNVEVPPPPPQASQLNTCQFSLDKKRPWRVDNACKAILDEVALRLQRDSDSKLVIVGHGDPSIDKNNAARFAAQRAANSKGYLSGGEAKQQIDPSRIEVRTGTDTGQTADYWLVPSGAAFNPEGTQPVDENSLTTPAKKRSAKKTAQ
jgi:outer membrane protein OmpA-like peptidoglycan-associated protein